MEQEWLICALKMGSLLFRYLYMWLADVKFLISSGKKIENNDQ